MKNLENLNLSDDQLKVISDMIKKSEEKYNKLAEENKSLKSQITERDTLIGEFEKNKTNVDELTKQIETFKQMEEKYKAEIEDNKLNDLVRGVIDKHNYVNDITKNGLFNNLKNALKDNNNMGKSAEELFNDMTKDMTDIFKVSGENDTPQVIIPPVGNTQSNNVQFDLITKAMGL